MDTKLVKAAIDIFETSRDIAITLDQDFLNNNEHEDIRSYLVDIIPELEFIVQVLNELV